MLRFSDRAQRAAAAALLGLLVVPPLPSSAEPDHDRRHRREAIRREGGSREHPDRARAEVRREHPDRREHARKNEKPHAAARRPEKHGRVHGVTPKHARHEHRDRRDGKADRREWERERARIERERRKEWKEWRERREEWREHHAWNHARYVAFHDKHWHWHGDRWCPPGHRHPHGHKMVVHHVHDDWRWARYRRPIIVHSGFYCAPCSTWFRDRHGFEHHVYGHHRLARHLFADAVAQLAWGLVYFGL